MLFVAWIDAVNHSRHTLRRRVAFHRAELRREVVGHLPAG
jgi:hypothetical protein